MLNMHLRLLRERGALEPLDTGHDEVVDVGHDPALDLSSIGFALLEKRSQGDVERLEFDGAPLQLLFAGPQFPFDFLALRNVRREIPIEQGDLPGPLEDALLEEIARSLQLLLQLLVARHVQEVAFVIRGLPAGIAHGVHAHIAPPPGAVPPEEPELELRMPPGLDLAKDPPPLVPVRINLPVHRLDVPLHLLGRPVAEQLRERRVDVEYPPRHGCLENALAGVVEEAPVLLLEADRGGSPGRVLQRIPHRNHSAPIHRAPPPSAL